MKAIILCGGEGTHLRPLTCTLPKPALSVCGKPVILYTLELLRRHGITSVTLSLGYKGDVLEDMLDGRTDGTEISFAYEDSPLGTAGAVASSADGEDVLVLCGDVLCDFDITRAISVFSEKNADAAVIVRRDGDYSSRTVFSTDDEGFVTEVTHRPPRESCRDFLSDGGVYILSASAVARIEKGGQCDLCREFFPKMLSSGMKIAAVEDSGYHCDIDDIGSYLRCQHDVLGNGINLIPDGHRTLGGITCSGRECYSGARITPPAYIGNNVHIGEGAVIDAYSVLCDNTTICRGAKIHGAVICEGAYVGERATCNEAVICQGARVSDGAAVYENAVVGAGSIVGRDAVVESGVRIWAKKEISPAADVSYDIKYGTGERIRISDDGICGDTGVTLTPSVAVTVGAALARISDRLCIGCNATPSGKALALAVASGAMAAGADVFFTGECTLPETDFAAASGNIPAECYVEGGATAKLRIFSSGGLPISRADERNIEEGLHCGDYPRASFARFGKFTDISPVTELYALTLQKKLGGTDDISVEISSSDRAVSALGRRIFSSHSGNERLIFNISSDGRRASAYSDKSGYVFYEKLLLLACREEFRHGKNVALPYSAPSAADLLATKYGTRVLRYCSCPSDNGDDEARTLAREWTAPLDAFSLAATVVRGLAERKQTLAEAVAELPDFNSVTRFVPMKNISRTRLRSVCEECVGTDEGILIGREGARVLLHPIKSGRGAMLFVESFKNESASEICDFYENELKKCED